MEVARASIWKTPFIGAYSKVFGVNAVVNNNAPQGFLRRLRDFLRVGSIALTNIGGVHAVSSMIAVNSNFIIAPDTVEDEELRKLKSLGKEIMRVESRLKAWGNMMILSDKGALFSTRVPRNEAKAIADFLGVDYDFASLANYIAIGALAVPGEELCFASKLLSEREKRTLEDVLKLRVYTVSVNDGLAFIRLGMLASPYGVLVGESTTGAELMHISLALKNF